MRRVGRLVTLGAITGLSLPIAASISATAPPLFIRAMKLSKRNKASRRGRLLAVVAAALLLGIFVWVRLFRGVPGPRRCHVAWKTLQSTGSSAKVVIVALSDVGRNVSKNVWDPKGRTFEGVLQATKKNKEDYANRHGYK